MKMVKLFDMEKKRTGIILLVSAILCVATMVFFSFALLDESDIVLEKSSGANAGAFLLDLDKANETTTGVLNPDAEVRGVWIATINNINFPSKKGLSEWALKSEIDKIIETCIDNNLNAVFFQVRPSADALYNSQIFPVSEYLSGTQGESSCPDFDVLAYLLEKAHSAGIKVHAWVNPLRVTYGSAQKPAHNTEMLAKDHPARKNPEYTVAYADGKLYFNAGIPEVRELVCDGVREIAENYDVDSIVFDDYFYPYSVTVNGKKATFDDSDAYKKYSDGESLDEWRRANINTLVRDCYDTIKEVDSEMLFGISPFGIWQNDNGTNGGSDTRGLEAYNELYCDARAFIEGGYVDYIAPQLYWSFTNSAARYDTLVRWWNALCDGTGVDLLISHGAYRYSEGWGKDSREIQNQIEFARSEISYKGSILYGYADLLKNTNGLADEVKAAFSNEIIYTSAVSNEKGISFNSPQNGATISGIDTTYLLGASDPLYPVYYNGQKLSRTKSGYFSLMLDLKKGKNEFLFNQNGKDYTYTIYNGTNQSSASTNTAPEYKIMDKYEIIPVSPKTDLFLSSSETVNITVKAPANSTVTAYLGKNSVKLTPTEKSPGKDKLYEMTYSSSLVLPKTEGGEILELGRLRIVATSKDESCEISPCEVRVGNNGAVIPIEVTADRTGLKIAPDSYYYDDFTTQAKGMRDNAVRLEDGYYLLRVGGYVKAEDATELTEIVPIAKVGSAKVVSDESATKIYIDTDVKIPMNGRVEDGYFILNLYNVDTATVSTPELSQNPLFESVKYELSTKKNCFRYHFKLKDPDAFYGFEFSYSDTQSIVTLRNQPKLAKGEKPLQGKTIVLDAGHGGYDMGALGADIDYSEAQINLRIVNSAKDKLEKLGANVVLTRTDDSYVALADRMNFVEELSPDLLISVHQNSMEYNIDVTKIRGIMSLYWEYAGKRLSNIMSDTIGGAVGRYNRGSDKQRLAMVRCERYPSTLIEIGFMTNVEEYEKTRSDEGIDTIAQAICDGVIEYMK